jgi:hypothetical protein
MPHCFQLVAFAFRPAAAQRYERALVCLMNGILAHSVSFSLVGAGSAPALTIEPAHVQVCACMYPELPPIRHSLFSSPSPSLQLLLPFNFSSYFFPILCPARRLPLTAYPCFGSPDHIFWKSIIPAPWSHVTHV